MENHPFLIIETSGYDSFVALQLASGGIAVRFLPHQAQAQCLVDTIAHLLKEHGVLLPCLHFIAVGQGPGSFTGSRIGILAAKMLGFAMKIPLLPFCSLKRFMPLDHEAFLVLADAKSHGFYAIKGDTDRHHVLFSKPFLIKADEIDEHIKSGRHILIPQYETRLRQLDWTSNIFSVQTNIDALASFLLQSFLLNQTVAPSHIEAFYLH